MMQGEAVTVPVAGSLMVVVHLLLLLLLRLLQLVLQLHHHYHHRRPKCVLDLQLLRWTWWLYTTKPRALSSHFS